MQKAELQRLKNVGTTLNKFTYCEKSPHTVDTGQSWHRMKDYGKRQITEDAPSPHHLGYRHETLSPPRTRREPDRSEEARCSTPKIST